MSGIKYLFDTNALIGFLTGNTTLQPYTNRPLGISVVSIIEFLSFPRITDEHKMLLDLFLHKAEVIDLDWHNTALIKEVTRVRSMYKLKLPDAIIAATSLHTNAVLVTNDHDFKKIGILQIATY